MHLEGLTGSFILSQSSKGEPTSAWSCVRLHDILIRETLCFKFTTLSTIQIFALSPIQPSQCAATPSGTNSWSKHYRTMLVPQELILRDTFMQLKCWWWCLEALGGCLLYLPIKLWWTVRVCTELWHRGKSPCPPWHLAWWLSTTPPSLSTKSSFRNISALKSAASSAKS